MLAVTHDGSYHSDDLLAAVLLKKLYPGIKIVRSRDPDVIVKADIAFDVGEIFDSTIQRYDHH